MEQVHPKVAFKAKQIETRALCHRNVYAERDQEVECVNAVEAVAAAPDRKVANAVDPVPTPRRGLEDVDAGHVLTTAGIVEATAPIEAVAVAARVEVGMRDGSGIGRVVDPVLKSVEGGEGIGSVR